MTTVISVRFRSGCKTYFFDPGDVQVQTGDHVIVETAQGLEYAQCTMGNHPVDDCCRKCICQGAPDTHPLASCVEDCAFDGKITPI